MWDIDGDGKLNETEQQLRAKAKEEGIDSHEGMLYSLMQDNTKLLKEQKVLMDKYFTLKKILAGSVVFVILMTLVGLASSFSAAILAKDTKVEGSALMTTHNEAVTTGVNEVHVTVGALAFLPIQAIEQIRTIAFTDPDAKIYARTVTSADVDPKKSVALMTAGGDSLVWNAENKKKVVITLNNGTSWEQCAGCDQCTMTNVLETGEITAALDEFHDVFQEGGRRLPYIPQGMTKQCGRIHNQCS
jgi:hypothetical protein